MASITEMLSDVKEHLEHGAELVASHIPALVEWAVKAQADPLVQAAIGLVVPDGTKAMLAGLLKDVEAEVQKVAADAKAAAQADAARPAEPDQATVEAAAAQAGAPAPDVIQVPQA